MSYCCEEFKRQVEEPPIYCNRKTTFSKMPDGTWWTDFSDAEYGDIEMKHCPFCGTRLVQHIPKGLEGK